MSNVIAYLIEIIHSFECSLSILRGCRSPERMSGGYSNSYIRGLSQKVVDFCYNTRLSFRNSMNFYGAENSLFIFYIHRINILHKFAWNHSFDNKVMNLYLTVCRRVRSLSNFLE